MNPTRIMLIVLALLTANLPCLNARIINIPDDIGTIQAGIDNCDHGDTLLVAPGRYEENINFNGMNIVIASHYILDNDEAFIRETIIDGGVNGSSTVVIRFGETATLTGFTIQNGMTDYGGGIYCRSSNPTLSHLIVTNNFTERNGAGIYVTQFSSPTIHDVVMCYNIAGYVGGGFGCYGGSTPTLTNCLIYDNYSDHVGGGIHAHSLDTEVTLNHVTVFRNSALHSGGAIYLTQNAQVQVTDCILWDNEPHEIQVVPGGGEPRTHIDISHSVVDGGCDEIEQWEVGGFTWRPGNIELDPQFIDAMQNNFRLTADSPCIDAGNPESEPDPYGTRSDMGAFYFHNEEGQHVLHVPDPFETIQNAIDEAEFGDIVLVQPGEYFENISFGGNDIVIGSRYLSTGEGLFIIETIINGGNDGPTLTFNENESEDALITGFTLTNGSFEEGGGVFIEEANPRLQNLIITGNVANEEGGGIAILNGNPNFEHCLISGNHADSDGGGVLATFEAAPSFTRCVFYDNNVGANGATAAIRRGATININFCTIYGNTAEEGGGAFYCVNGGFLNLANSIIWGNEPNAIEFADRGVENSVTISYCDLENGEEGVVTNDNGDVEWGEGNIDGDPLFEAPDGGNFHLTENSPCIDTGDPEARRDPDGTIPDMGAYYFHHEPFRDNFLFYVPDDYETIQEAVDLSLIGDTIIVRPGVYVENIDFRGIDITLASMYLTTGNQAYIDSTIIDGDTSDAVVIFNSHESSSTLLSGFTIRNGRDREGGGIYCYNSYPVIDHCLIHSNFAIEGGCGVFCYGAGPEIRNCTIVGNLCEEEGGAVYCRGGAFPFLFNTIIWENEPDQIFFSADRDFNGITIWYSDIEDGEDGIIHNNNGSVNWEEGNIDDFPEFIDAEAGNYHLNENSPCIDTGDPESPLDPDYTRADMGAFYFPQAEEFELALEIGWNMVSVNVDPFWMSFEEAVQPLLDEGVLLIAKDGYGNFCLPEFGFFDIENWGVLDGYMLKVAHDVEFTITGGVIPLDTAIPLEEGWNLVSYLPNVDVDPTLALSDLGDALIIAKDGMGRFYIPVWNYCNIDIMQQGQGYLLNVDNDIELVYQTEGEVAGFISKYNPADLAWIEEIPATDNSFSLLAIAEPAWHDRRLEVFTSDGLLVGRGVFDSRGRSGIAIWGDDNTTATIDGALPGQELKILLVIDNIRESLSFEVLEGDVSFTTDGFAVVRSCELNMPYTFAFDPIYPNPFNSETVIQFTLPEELHTELSVFDASGRLIQNVIAERLSAGRHSHNWNATNLANGIYFLELNAGADRAVRKVVLVK